MSAVAKRIYQENLALQEETSILRAENEQLQRNQVRLEHHARLAYLEGVDQGRAQAQGVA
jgi:cell division protein FtsB